MLDQLDQLDPVARRLLMKFVCSFAWADLEVRPQERAFVTRLMRLLSLDQEERLEVRRWLEIPPEPEAVDPADIPPEHRKLFVQVMERMAYADEELSEEERESLDVLRQLLR